MLLYVLLLDPPLCHSFISIGPNRIVVTPCRDCLYILVVPGMASQADPAIEPEFDIFSRVLPLPFRVAVIIVLGVWAWGLNLQYLRFLGIVGLAFITATLCATSVSLQGLSTVPERQKTNPHIQDVPNLIRYPARTSPTQPSHHLSTYRLATLLTIPLLTFLVLFWFITGASLALVPQWEIIPNVYLLVLIASFVLPLRKLSHSGRYRFLHIMKRISIGGLAQPEDGKFGDILLADVLTSYSKVLGDFFIAICMIFTREHSTARPNRNCGGVVIVPFLISVPFLIRLRQCLIEYARVRDGLAKGDLDQRQSGWGGQHLANALKYSTAFPVTILSALQRADSSDWGMNRNRLYQLWLITVFANSFYSFYWDVAKDWDLTLFESLGDTARSWLSNKPRLIGYLNGSANGLPSGQAVLTREEYPYGLRRYRYIHAPSVYYVVIALDLMLRCTWSFKLSPHLDRLNNLEGGIFVIQLLEVFRRWVWIFLRVETEWVRNNRGLASDDVLLGALEHRRHDED